MSTIKDIAQLAGVSRGTVDRVLNNRGAVKPETRDKILEIAEAIHYTPNIVGKTLAVKKKHLKFGYILFGSTASNPFFEDVVRGIESRAAELEGYGVSVEIRYAAIHDPDQQVALMDELVAAGINGLAITPINHEKVVAKIRALGELGIPVVTVNSDVPDSGRIAYVGSNYYKSGETAAGLMNIVCGGGAKVGIIIGSPLVLCHSQRVAGFTDRIDACYPGIRIVGTAVNNDEDFESYDVTRQLLQEHPEIDALFLAAAGVVGACRAVEAVGRKGELKIISYDAMHTTRRLVEERAIVATIAQQPFTQGAKPLDILLDYLGMGLEPEKEFYFTKIEIRILENI